MRKLDEISFGAWVIKANPDRWDVIGAWSDGSPVESWPVFDTYRLEHLSVGQPVVMWATTNRDVDELPSFCGAGFIDGPVFEGVGEGEYWLDDEEKDKQQLYVPIRDWTWWEAPAYPWLLDPSSPLQHVEPITSTKMSNPNVLTEEEYAKLQGLQVYEIRGGPQLPQAPTESLRVDGPYGAVYAVGSMFERLGVPRTSLRVAYGSVRGGARIDVTAVDGTEHHVEVVPVRAE